MSCSRTQRSAPARTQTQIIQSGACTITNRPPCLPTCVNSCCFCDSSASEVSSPGQPVGKGLTKEAATDLGLWEGMPVGTSLIDAHAGGLGKSAYTVDKPFFIIMILMKYQDFSFY